MNPSAFEKDSIAFLCALAKYLRTFDIFSIFKIFNLFFYSFVGATIGASTLLDKSFLSSVFASKTPTTTIPIAFNNVINSFFISE
jgi:hypothetical protein